MIATKEHGNHNRVGTRTRSDETEKGNGFEQWIRKEMSPIL
jgi:hypothetical protein